MNDLQVFQHYLMLKEKFEKAYGVDFPYFVNINDNLKGRTAGYAITKHGTPPDKYEIRLNAYLLQEYGQTFLDGTLTHEAAHIFVDWFYIEFRKDSDKPPAHGREWKLMMRNLGANRIERCHAYETKPARKVRKWIYKCSCREHTITNILHNKIQRDTFKVYQRRCVHCKVDLTFVREK